MSQATYPYDAFISYRRQDPDKQFARNLRQSLMAAGYRVAFDEVDFAPQASFLEEMERCVRQSRFVLAVVSPRYFASGNTQEEAIITKVMDMADRKRRLIPLTIEAVELPYWLYNLVGIRFDDDDPLIPPFDKLKTALGDPLSGSRPSGTTPPPAPPAPSPPPPMTRMELIRTLGELAPPDFQQLVYALKVPNAIMPATAAPGSQAFALLQWAESPTGCGLDKVIQELQTLLP